MSRIFGLKVLTCDWLHNTRCCTGRWPNSATILPTTDLEEQSLPGSVEAGIIGPAKLA